MKNGIKLYGVIGLAVLLLVAIGCYNGTLSPRISLTGITLNAGGEPVAGGGYVIINTDDYKVVTATAVSDRSGGGDAVFTWEVEEGSGVAELSSNEGRAVFVTAVAEGEATIRVSASNGENEVQTRFNVVVLNEGGFTFYIYDGTTVIPDTGSIEIPSGGEGKSITLRALPDGEVLNYTWSSANANATISPASGDSVVISATGAAGSSAGITITATKDGVTVRKLFTVKVTEILMVWDSTVNPVAVPAYQVPGYANVYMRLREHTIGAIFGVNGALKYGGAGIIVLVVGGEPETATTTTTATTPHLPGVFNLSQGKFRITVDYKDVIIADPANNSYLRFAINNNGGGANASVLGGNSHIIDLSQADLKDGVTNKSNTGTGTLANAKDGKAVVEVAASRYGSSPPASLSNAFFAMGFSGSYSITVTGIKIERIE